MKKHYLSILTFGLTIMLLLSSYTSRLLAAETFDVGVLLPLTGYQEAVGSMEKQAFELAAKKFNQDTDRNGQRLNLIFIDSAANPERALKAVRKVVAENDDNLRMLTGGCHSPATWAVAEYAQQHKIPFLINTASSGRITEQGWDYVFRLNPPEEEYLLAPISRLVKDAESYQSAAIVYEDSICMTETARKLKRLCGRLNLDLSIWYGYHSGRRNFKRLGDLLTEKQPDILLLAGKDSEAGIILSKCRKMEFPPVLMIGCSPAFSRPETWDTAGENAEGLKTIILWKEFSPNPGASEFAREYRLNFSKSPDYHAAEAYAAFEVIADIFPRTLTYTREEIKDLLAAIELMTVFGPVKFITDNQYTNQNRLAGHLCQWHEGSLELVGN